jgi:hypothetical protein
LKYALSEHWLFIYFSVGMTLMSRFLIWLVLKIGFRSKFVELVDLLKRWLTRLIIMLSTSAWGPVTFKAVPRLISDVVQVHVWQSCRVRLKVIFGAWGDGTARRWKAAIWLHCPEERWDLWLVSLLIPDHSI